MHRTWGFRRRGARLAFLAALALASLPDARAHAETPAPAAARKASSPSDPKPVEYPEWETLAPGEYLGYNQRASLLQRGRIVYAKYCVGCHGSAGDGKGPAAARLLTKPRDFTKGVYKFRSTNSSSLPLESDLHRTITKGLPRVSMPAFPLMPEGEKVAVIEYIKAFYPRWDEDAPEREVVRVPRAPSDLGRKERIQRGRVVYVVMQCGKCHGWDGAGKGATETEYTDAWGNKQRAFNFTRGRLKGGDDPEDVYRTFHTGLISVMPEYGGLTLAAVARDAFDRQRAFLGAEEQAELEPALASFAASYAEGVAMLPETEQQALAERNSWDLVAYVLSLRHVPTTASAVLGDGAR